MVNIPLSGMTEAQADVLLGLNVLQMQRENGPIEDAPWAREIAKVCDRSTRSTAAILSQMRDFGWVESLHVTETVSWRLTAKGVAAMERNRKALGSR